MSNSKTDNPREVLARSDSTMAQLTQAVTALEKEKQPRSIMVGISSSVTVDLLHVYLRKQGVLNGTKIEIVTGNYDDPISDITLFTEVGVEQIMLLPFFDNLLPSFEAQLENLDSEIIDSKEEELRQRYRIVFNKARAVPVVYLGTFHRLGRAADVANQDLVSIVLSRFNTALFEEAAAFANIRIIDMEDIVRTIGHNAAFDSRFYFRNKSPYTCAFMNELAQRVAASSRGFGAYFYKVLALDCDNTLWGGVIGEDLLSGIKLDPYDYPGNIFWLAQKEFSALERQGILLVLISKNNLVDVDEVMHNHPSMVLKESQIVAKKVNWDDKSANLRALGKELNVGLESFVFLDDSSFECDAVRQQLPMVKVIQVPKALSEYPKVLADIKSLFLAGGISTSSIRKTEQYRQRAGAEALKAQFETQEEYLGSLNLKVELTLNDRTSVRRISELSQKSNQFNLTTRRYSVAEIEQMMKDSSYAVYSLVVCDKFGNAGLTGVAVIRYTLTRATVENFFMSCRVIGRGVETVIWTPICANALKRGCSDLSAEFIPSHKNMQVADFYDRIGMTMTQEGDGARHYLISLIDFNTPDNDWIEMTYVE